jgi:hypothetical protein
MPFDFALVIAFSAARSAFAEASLSLLVAAASTALIIPFNFERSVLLRWFLFSACLARLMAERFFFTGAFAAKVLSSLRNESYFLP